ncbi:hypothetical protein SAMN04489752_0517 [Brevibacterium siliguriense]|uniref:Uncharacterized protein n=1 Tax=Brevibacterium siliguriense TaxID=1136497 RepID=A0A1H1MT71_9MICO|nr:hypothetical protein [Brevibacterium siliguriense]SDR89119.1 hypothetical protein SAMN04489752_0517 [Brevibacterium siliguriense]
MKVQRWSKVSAFSSVRVLGALGLSSCGPSRDEVDPESRSFRISGDDLGIVMDSGVTSPCAPVTSTLLK